MRARNGTRRTSCADADPGPPILTEENQYKINICPLNMACLVVDDARCVPGMGRGAHPARTSETTPSGRGHPTCQKPMQSLHVSAQRALSCRRLCEISGRNGTRCISRATGQSVALASAPRTCFLKVALPLRRGAHSLADSSSAWGPLELPRVSWNILEPPQGLVDPPGASWDSLGLPETSLGFLKLPGTSWSFLGPPGASLGFLGPHGASCNLLGSPEASWGLLRLPGASWCILGSC